MRGRSVRRWCLLSLPLLVPLLCALCVLCGCSASATNEPQRAQRTPSRTKPQKQAGQRRGAADGRDGARHDAEGTGHGAVTGDAGLAVPRLPRLSQTLAAAARESAPHQGPLAATAMATPAGRARRSPARRLHARRAGASRPRQHVRLAAGVVRQGHGSGSIAPPTASTAAGASTTPQRTRGRPTATTTHRRSATTTWACAPRRRLTARLRASPRGMRAPCAVMSRSAAGAGEACFAGRTVRAAPGS